MSITPGARRADEFARLLDAPARTDDPALAPYLALATALRAVPTGPGPSPEFRTALRQRLVAVATVQPAGSAAESPGARVRSAAATWRVQRRLAVVAGGAAAATAIAGVAVGASHSIPGDAFYGLKRATERVQLDLTSGKEAKGKRHLEFARTRLHEVEALVGHDSALTAVLPGGVQALGALPDEAKAATIISTLQDMDSETRAGAQDLLAVALDNQASDALHALNTFTRTQFDDLRAVLPELPAAAQPRATQSLTLLSAVAGQSLAVSRQSSGAGQSAHNGTGSTPAPPTSTPHRTAHPSSAPGGATSSSAPTPGRTPDTTTLPSVPTSVPTQAPTIPPLPTLSPLPSVLPLPSSLPTLPDLGGLLPNQGG